MKKILIGAIILLTIFLIYLGTVDKKVYYLSLGDSYAVGITPYGNKSYSYGEYIEDYLNEKKVLETYIKGYATFGYRTIDLIRDIEDNKEITINNKNKRIKNALIKADLITISIGINDIMSKLTSYRSFSTEEIYTHLDEFLEDLELLFKMVREYCKEDIIFLGYYNFLGIEDLDNIFEYLNNRVIKICNDYKIDFLPLDDTFKKYQENPKDIHPNTEGYYYIYEKMKEIIDKKIFK